MLSNGKDMMCVTSHIDVTSNRQSPILLVCLMLEEICLREIFDLKQPSWAIHLEQFKKISAERSSNNDKN